MKTSIFLNLSKYGSWGVQNEGMSPAGPIIGQNRYSFLHLRYPVEVKVLFSDGIDQVYFQNQVLKYGKRSEHCLLVRQAFRKAIDQTLCEVNPNP